MIFVAAWHALLVRLFGDQQSEVGIVVANRSRRELQSMIGPMSDIMILRVDLNDNPTLAEVLGQVREGVLDALAHQGFPYEWAAVAAGGPPDRRGWIPRAMFEMDECVAEEGMFGGLQLSEEPLPRNVISSDLVLVIRQAGRMFNGTIEYNARLLGKDRMASMTAAYGKLIQVVTSDLDCRIMNLPPLLS